MPRRLPPVADATVSACQSRARLPEARIRALEHLADRGDQRADPLGGFAAFEAVAPDSGREAARDSGGRSAASDSDAFISTRRYRDKVINAPLRWLTECPHTRGWSRAMERVADT